MKSKINLLSARLWNSKFAEKFDQNISILTWSESMINRVTPLENNCIFQATFLE